MKYYVYFYLRENGTPYYVGKGCGTRAFKKHKSGNESNITPKEKSRIRFIETGLDEFDALYWENFWIEFYGRKDLGTGILNNRTNGWDVIPDVTGIPKTDEHKRKLADSNRGKIKPMPRIICPHCNKEGGAQNMQRYHFNKCKIITNEIRTKKEIQCPHCNFVGRGNMNRYHFDNCKERS